MGARERIAAAVEYVRSGQGNFEQCSRHFRMTIDVVKKACAEAGVTEKPRQPAPARMAPRFDPFKALFLPDDDRLKEALKDRTRELRVEKRVTRDMARSNRRIRL